MKPTADEVINRLRSKDPKERRLGLMLAGTRCEYAAVPLCSRALLTEDDAEMRGLAAWALGILCSPVTVPALIEALYDPIFDVRSNAGWALVHIAQRTIPEVVIPDVIDVMRDGDHHDARLMAYLVLSNIGGRSAREAIRMYWRES
jgi:HEAT repeat protein